MTELAVLVPVLNRPQNVGPLVESFLAGCPEDSELWFLISRDDIAEWDALDSCKGAPRVFYGETLDTSWPRKINFGVYMTDSDWVLCAADDITFTPGWWDEIMKVHYLTGARAIGTNDMANPRTIAGEHSTHTVIARTYIDELGTIDEVGKAVHDGYHHWYVDDELLWTAKLRGEWAHATNAIVAHHHPYFDPTIPMDSTYQRGEANAEADLALWKDRAVRLLGLQVQ